MKTQSWARATFNYLPSLSHLLRILPSSLLPLPLHSLSIFYKKNRYNFLSQKDFEKNDPPFDGKITWIKGEVRGDYVYGVKNAKGEYEYECRYDEGPKDREWMEAKDKEYLKHLLNTGKLRETEPDVWRLREIDRAQEIDIGEWWSQKLKLPNILKRSEQDYERFIAEEARKKGAEEERQRQLKEKQEQERQKKLEEENRQKAEFEREQKIREQKEQRVPPPAKELPPLPAYKSLHAQKAFIDDEGQIKVTVTLIPYNTLTFGRCLGEGGFGTVYQGKWQYDEVAIKQLRMTSMSAETLAEFKSEASIMANLRHPRIIGFYGISVDTPGRYSIVMDYMAGGSLYNLLHNQQPLIWESRYRIALDVTSGLAHLHSKDILHRDLKSLNVLLDSQLRARLTDFGLSRIKTETTTTTATASSQSVGTLQWMAPELFQRRAKYTKNADMYSYGMVLWELASRKVPFSDAHNREILIKWLGDGEQEEIPQDCPTGFAKLIKWCWNQVPTRRPTIDQAANALEAEPAEQSLAPSYRDNLDSQNLSLGH
jgi:predicted Ser/Thr protein kinase